MTSSRQEVEAAREPVMGRQCGMDLGLGVRQRYGKSFSRLEVNIRRKNISERKKYSKALGQEALGEIRGWRVAQMQINFQYHMKRLQDLGQMTSKHLLHLNHYHSPNVILEKCIFLPVCLQSAIVFLSSFLRSQGMHLNCMVISMFCGILMACQGD